MKTVDGYLSRLAQEVYRDAVVYQEEAGGRKRYILERRGEEPVGLGETFRDAKTAVQALRRSGRTHGTA